MEVSVRVKVYSYASCLKRRYGKMKAKRRILRWKRRALKLLDAIVAGLVPIPEGNIDDWRYYSGFFE
jgi:hypothetical protein